MLFRIFNLCRWWRLIKRHSKRYAISQALANLPRYHPKALYFNRDTDTITADTADGLFDLCYGKHGGLCWSAHPQLERVTTAEFRDLF